MERNGLGPNRTAVCADETWGGARGLRLGSRPREAGGVDLGATLVLGGWDPAQPEQRVDLLLGLAAEALAAVETEHPVLVQGEPGAQGEAAQPDVVALRAGEVLPRGAELLGSDGTAVDLEATAGVHRALGVTAEQHPLDRRECGELGAH